jgi:hypothetical protein
LTNKFARRFVMLARVKIHTSHRYVQNKAQHLARRSSPPNQAPDHGRLTMRKTILTIIGSALLVASTAQIAAAEHHKARKIYRTQAPVTDTIRDSNAYYGWPSAQPDWSRYQNGAESAPAGH